MTHWAELSASPDCQPALEMAPRPSARFLREPGHAVHFLVQVWVSDKGSSGGVGVPGRSARLVLRRFVKGQVLLMMASSHEGNLATCGSRYVLLFPHLVCISWPCYSRILDGSVKKQVLSSDKERLSYTIRLPKRSLP